MDIPEKLNGYPVIGSAPKRGATGSYMVLVEKTDEFVVATWNRNCGREWVWGHYFLWGPHNEHQTRETALRHACGFLALKSEAPSHAN